MKRGKGRIEIMKKINEHKQNEDESINYDRDIETTLEKIKDKSIICG